MSKTEADVMKSTFFHLVLVSIIAFGFFSTAIVVSCDAEEVAQLSIVQKNAEKIKTIGNGMQTAVYYKITIVLHNAGNVTSEEITLGIQDEADKLWTNKTGTVPADESTEFVFDDWPVVGPGEHNVRISYRPTNDSVTKTSFNSGVDALSLTTIGEEGNENTTPGFELIMVLGALAALVLPKKR